MSPTGGGRDRGWTALTALAILGFLGFGLRNLGDGAVTETQAAAPSPLFAWMGDQLGARAARLLGLSPLSAHALWALLAGTAALLSLALLLRGRWGGRTTFLSVSLMALFPRFVGEAQRSPEDLLAVALTILGAQQLLLVAERRYLRTAAGCGLVMGLAVDCSRFNLLLLALLAVALLIPGFADGAGRSRLGLWAVALLVAIATALAGWPALWRDPGQLLRAVQGLATSASGSLPIVALALATPIPLLAFALVGLGRVFASAPTAARRRAAIVAWCWFVVPFGLASWPGLSSQASLRDLCVALPPFFLFGALGVESLLDGLQAHGRSARVQGTVVALLLAELSVEVVRSHPFEDRYLNQIGRLVRPAQAARR